jgi:hypothetical protein
LAASSAEAARLGKELGDAQLAEAKRQYDINRSVAEPVAQAQLDLMRQTRTQGDDYYKYMTETFRPLERGMVATATKEGSDARLEEAAAQAAADMRRGQTQQANMMARQGLRYGYSPAKMAAMAGQMAGANATANASAMTNARNNQRNLGWARQMDAAGLGRNLPGASQGAYGLTISAGNAATGNTMAPGGALLNGMAQGAGMQQQGMGQQMQGLSNIYNGQISMNNAALAQDSGSSGIGSIIGAGLGAWAKTGFAGVSDRRLKRDVEFIGIDADTGLRMYEFSYVGDDPARYRGVMADEVAEVMPEAVAYSPEGYAMVNYSMLGMQMTEAHHGTATQ